MNPKYNNLYRLCVLMFIFIPCIVEGTSTVKVEKEKLLFDEIPIVITASKKEQPITEAPTTITVISSDDIRYSGATTIPDVLRMVAGVDVMTISSRDQQVGVRGFITPVNNKLLVLMDGRTVYTDFNGSVFWDMFPVGIEEIDRIEIVKSPASSVYGANAFSGVINVITKTPEQLDGVTMQFTGGSYDLAIASIIQAGFSKDKKFSYKVSGGYDQIEGLNNNENQISKIIRFNAKAIYKPGENTSIELSGGRTHSKDRKLYTGESIGTGRMDYVSDYLQLDIDTGKLEFHTFYKYENPIVEWPFLDQNQTWKISTLNAELIHSFHPIKNQNVTWGFNYRHNWLEKSPLIKSNHEQNLWALFLEDEIKISSRFHLTFGVRYDDHPLVKNKFSPRGNIIYMPSKNNTIKISVSQAYHNPSFIESYIYYEHRLNYFLPNPLPQIEVPMNYITTGNPNLEPESIISYEFGWHSRWSKRISFDLNLYYNRYNRFFQFSRDILYYLADELFPGSPGGIFPKAFISSYTNRDSASAVGGDIQAEFLIGERIFAFINYAYQKFHYKEEEPFSPHPKNINVETETPKNKINAGLRFLFKNRLSLNILGHWVDKTLKMVKDPEGKPVYIPLNDYLTVDARIGYTARNDKYEIGLTCFNLFNPGYYEFPFYGVLSNTGSERIGRRIALTLKMHL